MGRGPVSKNQSPLQQLQQQMLANTAASSYYNNAQMQQSQMQYLGYATTSSLYTAPSTKRVVRPLAVSYECVSDLLAASKSATGDVIPLSVIAKPNLEWLKHLIQRRK